MFIPENVHDDHTSPNVKEIKFAENGVLETIGNYAFINMSNITEITIPKSVVKINDNAFSACEKLEKLTFAEDSKLERIGEVAFSDCLSLTSVKFPTGLKTIDDDAFYISSNKIGALQSVYIPATVSYVGSAAFYKNVKTGTPVKAYLEAAEVPMTWSADWNILNVEAVTGYDMSQVK
jgi:hypothetical protein